MLNINSNIGIQKFWSRKSYLCVMLSGYNMVGWPKRLSGGWMLYLKIVVCSDRWFSCISFLREYTRPRFLLLFLNACAVVQ